MPTGYTEVHQFIDLSKWWLSAILICRMHFEPTMKTKYLVVFIIVQN